MEIKSDKPPQNTARNQRPNNNRNTSNKLKDKVDKATEGKDTDFHNVVRTNRKNTKKNNMVPQYPVSK